MTDSRQGASECMNDERTCTQSGAKLTHSCSPDVHGSVAAWRHRHKGSIWWNYTSEEPDGPSIHLFEVQPLYAATPGWQPIETAPMNHLAVLVYGPYGRLVAFRDVGWAWWSFPNGDGPLDYMPTHWMPLPSPPETTP